MEYLEDNPMTWIRGLPNHGAGFRPLRIGMAEIYGLYINVGDPIPTYKSWEPIPPSSSRLV